MSKSPNPLPKTLPGVVLPQMVRCGKPNCKCASRDPGDLHGPYYYRFWREGGRLRKQYVPLDEVDAVRAACPRRRVAEARRKRRAQAHRDRLRAQRDDLRDVEDLLDGCGG